MKSWLRSFSRMNTGKRGTKCQHLLRVSRPNFDIVDTCDELWPEYSANDCPLALSGNLLDDTAKPYAQTFYNLAWRDFQSDMAQAGDPAQTEEALILGLPPVATIDPGVQTFLSQTQFFDGVGYFATPPTVQVFTTEPDLPSMGA